MPEAIDGTWALAGDSRGDTEGLVVRFEMYPLQSPEKSKAEGRPVFDEVEFIEIRVPGDKTMTVHRPVREADKQRFGAAYRNWKATGVSDGAFSGTPLKEWPQVSRSQCEELSFFGVKTVEQLANVTDGNLRNIGPLLALREKARDFIAAAKKGAPVAQMRDELAARDSEIALLKQQMAQVLAAAEKKAEGKKTKEA